VRLTSSSGQSTLGRPRLGQTGLSQTWLGYPRLNQTRIGQSSFGQPIEDRADRLSEKPYAMLRRCSAHRLFGRLTLVRLRALGLASLCLEKEANGPFLCFTTKSGSERSPKVEWGFEN